MDELKPCPFCGTEPTVIVRRGKAGWRDKFAVLCDHEQGGCGAESGWYHNEEEAVETWNKRVGAPDNNVGWISVKDRLPEEDRVVLATVHWEKHEHFCVEAAMLIGGEWYSTADLLNISLKDSLKVIAWQYLPEPYKLEVE